MATLNVQKASLSGLTVSMVAATAGGDTFPNDGYTFLQVKNDDASEKTITIGAVRACNHGFMHDATVAIAAGDTKVIGPFPVERFGGTPDITYSAVTSVTIAAIKL